MASEEVPLGYKFVLPDDMDDDEFSMGISPPFLKTPTNPAHTQRRTILSHCIAFLMGAVVLCVYLIVSDRLENPFYKKHTLHQDTQILHQNQTIDEQTSQQKGKTQHNLHKEQIHLHNWDNWLNDATNTYVTVEPDAETETVTLKPTSNPSIMAMQNKMESNPTFEPTSNPSLIAAQNQQKSLESEPTFKPTTNPSIMAMQNKQEPTFKPTTNPSITAAQNKQESIESEDIASTTSEHLSAKKLLFEHFSLLQTESNEFTNLRVKVNLEGKDVLDHSGGALNLKLRYPNHEDMEYENYQNKKWCYYFAFDPPTSAQTPIDRIGIDVEFNYWNVETGFDRILITHFINTTVIEPPVVIAGRGNDYIINTFYEKINTTPRPLHYFMEYGESKALCFDFQSDGSIVGKGLEFTINVRYDACKWSEWSECYAVDMTKVGSLDRGPFCNGKCGIGIQHRNRTNEAQKEIQNEYQSSFIDCAQESITEQPQYCIVAPCENMGDTDFIKGARYAFHEPYSLWWNGNGRIDPKYANPFDIHRASTNDKIDTAYPLYTVDPDTIYNLDAILSELQELKMQISSEHVEEDILKDSIVEHEHDYDGTTKEYLGSRLLHSLLIGRPFIYAFEGSSNTAGHDNQFLNTYPEQLQSRLQDIWERIGVDGAAFTVRNIAIGGSPNTKTSSWYAHITSSGTHSYLNDETFSENIDVIGWESYMNDGGRPPHEWLELHIRMAASLNAIWSGLESLGGHSGDCAYDEQYVRSQYLPFVDVILKEYSKYMGILQVRPSLGLTHLSCNTTRYAEAKLKMNWHPNARGHRLEADVHAYLLLDAVIEFINKYKAQILEKNINELDGFLLDKSGDWRNAMIKSITAQQQHSFPLPLLCGDYCKSIPFSLISFEPSIYNTAHRLKDYVIGNKHSVSFNDDLISGIGWSVKMSSKHDEDYYGLWRKQGGQQSNDMKMSYIVNEPFFAQVWKDFDNDDLDAFEKHLVDIDYVMRFYIYVPKYGNSSIRTRTAFGKQPCPLNGNRMYLKNINDESVALGERSEDCVWNNLQPDNKYIVSIVPVNLTKNPSKSEFNYFSGY